MRGSEYETKKKQHVCATSGLCDHYHELFAWMAAPKLQNTVTNPYRKDKSVTDL